MAAARPQHHCDNEENLEALGQTMDSVHEAAN